MHRQPTHKHVVPQEIVFTEADLERLVEWSAFDDEIAHDSDRGTVLAVASRVEHALKVAIAKREQRTLTSRSSLPFGAAIDRAEKLQIIAPGTAALFRALKELRNEAAHSPSHFFVDGGTARPFRRLSSAFEPHFQRLHEDPQYERYGTHALGHFKIIGQILWRFIMSAAEGSHSQLPLHDLVPFDPEVWCLPHPGEEIDDGARQLENQGRVI